MYAGHIHFLTNFVLRFDLGTLCGKMGLLSIPKACPKMKGFLVSKDLKVLSKALTFTYESSSILNRMCGLTFTG